MHINDLPEEILSDILLRATTANENEGVSYTYGLTEAQLPLERPKIQKYVRGPVTAEHMRWDATDAIRGVCHRWHEWAISYNLESVFERKWQGGERWANLPVSRKPAALYDLIHRPSSTALRRDPYGSIKNTNKVFKAMPYLTNHVRRLWFNGFYTKETDELILSIIAACDALQTLTIPWTVLRRSTPEDWIDLLNVNTGHGSPLESLELQAQCLRGEDAASLMHDNSLNPLAHPRVDFSALKRLRIFGNTLNKPVCDDDLHLIARTATHLEVLDFTNLSTVSVAGMLALVKASRETLQVLEHSPRSDDGFYHPYPGNLDSGEHICELLTSLPKMRDLSISIPYMCADLFADPEVLWEGECQVRATDLCGCDSSTPASVRASKLRRVFAAARDLIAARARMHRKLSIELFFAGCIFEPEKRLVHGDFTVAQMLSHGQWPRQRFEVSTKGPYGNTGVYGDSGGKGEDSCWDAVWEEDYLSAVEAGWMPL